jgi:hypothetical protein
MLPRDCDHSVVHMFICYAAIYNIILLFNALEINKIHILVRYIKIQDLS